jgi:hypothetical protein
LFVEFGGWSSLDPSTFSEDAMRRFMAQNPRRVASFLRACELRASELPPDEVLFGDPVAEASDEEFLECDDTGVDEFLADLDSLLGEDGFLVATP